MQLRVLRCRLRRRRLSLAFARVAIAILLWGMTMPEMPRYRCHKIVGALKIREVSPAIHGGVTVAFEEAAFSPEYLDAKMVTRYMPIAGDYLVEYQGDGYRSISPAKAFEDGYSRID